MSGNHDRRWNVIAGWATLGVLLGAVLIIAVSVSIGAALPEPRTYVLYVTNSGTLRNGDPVYMSGRQIGTVTETEIVSHEGEVQTRVVIELDDRFRDLELPNDSRASVGPPGLVSGPRLFIIYGSAESVIEQGGEIKETSPAPLKDDFTSYGDQLASATEQIGNLIAVLDDEELVNSIKQNLLEFRDAMKNMAQRMENLQPYAADMVNMLKSRPEQLEDLLAEVRYGIGDVSGQLDSLIAALDEGANNLDELREQTSETIARLEEYQDLSARAAERTEDPAVKNVFLQARWQSAEMAAMLRLSVENPAAAGDLPRGRRVNQAFNGGKTTLGPLGGDTDVSEFK